MADTALRYVVVFDVGEGGYREWRLSAAGLVFLVVGAVFLSIRRRAAFGLPVGALFLVCSLLWTTSTFVLTYCDYSALSTALREGRCQVVEGRVTQFDPMPAGGHRDESFVVGGHRFVYSDYTLTAGFHNARSHGGPMRDGIDVRVHYYGAQIARLEVAN